ncbi:involucrin-like [Xiphophorus couchianus]|uniref:involucrin-like n=1 Tax=Xiphophorus couchianus TaxID=32473 RepID=UPI001015F941|nr:involucrin-like [Xiphophorus couchianus]
MDMEGETNKQQSDQHVQEDKSKEETESSITDMKEETNKQQSDQSLSTKNGENKTKSGPAETEEPENKHQEENNHHDQKSDNNPIQSSSGDMKEETNKQQSDQPAETEEAENRHQEEKHVQEDKSKEETESSINDMKEETNKQQSDQPAETEEAENRHQEEKHVQEDKSKEETESSINDMKEETNKQQSDQPAETEEAENRHQEEKHVQEDKSKEETESSINDMKEETNKQQSDHLTQMESYYKELKKKDSTIKKIKKELKSLKDRLAQDMAVSIKTGDTESMNDPVSKTRLTEMYDSLKLEKWTGIKDLLKSNKTSPEFTRALVQKTFKEAAEEMIRKKQQIEETFGSTQSSGGQGNQKVEGYRKLAVHNLQLALYHSNKDLLKSPFPKYEGEKAEDVMVNLRCLTSECYWLGCLIALNNPPLQPDWETQHYMKNSWDIFPQRLKDCDK